MAKRKGSICIKFDKQPPGTHYKPGTYSWVSDSSGQEYIDEGYGSEHDPKKTREARRKAREKVEEEKKQKKTSKKKKATSKKSTDNSKKS